MATTLVASRQSLEEVLLSAGMTSAEMRRVQRQATSGLLRRNHKGIYLATDTDVELIVPRQLATNCWRHRPGQRWCKRQSVRLFDEPGEVELLRLGSNGTRLP